jgi:ABC-2 type transport system ATP-binding protein
MSPYCLFRTHMAAIQTNGLTKEFGDVVAVDALDLEVREGEVFGFLGPNGAGKSTTINVLLGFTEPTGGTATVLGHDVVSESMALRQRIGVLPEGFTVYDRLTAREHVGYAGDLKGVTPDRERLLERVGLEREAWDRRAGGFSKGMRQRLALACALVGDPELLILDEPSSGLDPEGMREMRELIREEAEKGTTVFFSSHLLSEVEAVCDRVGILTKGKITAIGTIDELRDGASGNATVDLHVEHVPDGMAREVGGMDGVAEASAEEGVLHVEVSDPEAKVPVIRHVDARVTVEDLVAEEASLESLFTEYTNGDAESAEDAPEIEVQA